MVIRVCLIQFNQDIYIKSQNLIQIRITKLCAIYSDHVLNAESQMPNTFMPETNAAIRPNKSFRTNNLKFIERVDSRRAHLPINVYICRIRISARTN